MSRLRRVGQRRGIGAHLPRAGTPPYDIAIGQTQALDITARLASAYSGRSIRIEIDGQNVTGSLVAPASGWQGFQDVVAQNVVVTEGIHRVRVYMETGDTNLNYLQFSP